MINYPASALFDISRFLVIEQLDDSTTVANVEDLLRRVERACQSLELSVSLLHAGEILEQLPHLATLEKSKALLASLGGPKGTDSALSEIKSQLGSLGDNIKRELSTKTVLLIEREKLRYFEQGITVFGVDVESGFPSAIYEVDEATKCLALGRATAAVFHLMRVMEIGIKAVVRCMAIPDPTRPSERNWGVILQALKSGIDARSRGTSSPWSKQSDKALFEELYASIDAVRNAWRNATMHVESKYNDEEAEHILTAVRGFMRKLALRCNEQGLPLA